MNGVKDSVVVWREGERLQSQQTASHVTYKCCSRAAVPYSSHVRAFNETPVEHAVVKHERLRRGFNSRQVAVSMRPSKPGGRRFQGRSEHVSFSFTLHQLISSTAEMALGAGKCP